LPELRSVNQARSSSPLSEIQIADAVWFNRRSPVRVTAKTTVEAPTSKAGYSAGPIETNGKHHPQPTRKEEREPAKRSDAVHKVADTVRGWLPSSETPKEG
jgi:hypothetical protein